MSNGAIRFSEEIEYYTPKYIVDKFGPFDYDPATTVAQAEHLEIPNYDTKETNGLFSDWTKYDKIWINPPFTEKYEFLLKAVRTFHDANRYIDICILLPISFLTTKKFSDIMDYEYYDLFLPNGRIKFENNKREAKSPAFGSVIIRLNFEGSKRIIPLEI